VLRPQNNAVIASVVPGHGDWTKYLSLLESF
jgi:hypothetical protein